MLDRIIVPELLDSLEPDDPDAMRSRSDLRRLDHFLGGSRWIERVLAGHRSHQKLRIVEIGAGEGILCARLARAFPEVSVTGLDLAPRPPHLPDSVGWVSGDFFQSGEIFEADVVVGNLILHHFDESSLKKLAAHIDRACLLIFSEPWRDHRPLFFSHWAAPFVGRVTRHDMPASIRAGFRARELPEALGLSAPNWIIRESSHWRGVLRMVAWRA